MRFLRANNLIVEIGPEALAAMLGYRQLDKEASEAGGILLGRIINATDAVIIDEATVPGPEDTRSRFFFFRRRERAQKRIRDAWRETSGTRIYLGEWHTHPEDNPQPSDHDQDNWRRVVQTAQFEQSFLLFIIVGRGQLSIWELSRGSNALTILQQRPPS